MANFKRYLVTIIVTSAGADHTNEDETTFSTAATSPQTAISAVKSALTEITHVTELEVTDVELQDS